MNNYQKKLERMFAAGELQPSVGLNDLLVCHDDWCNCFRGGECNCDPDITLRTNVSIEDTLKLYEESRKAFRDLVNKKKQ